MSRRIHSRHFMWGGTCLFALFGALLLAHARAGNSATFDEPHHLATGLELLQYGTYRWWTENPPLGRIAIAALPYLDGIRLPPPELWDPRHADSVQSWPIGLNLLYAGRGYDYNLARARLGTFPFYLILVMTTWLLARGGRRCPLAGLVAVGLCATLPSLLAHGGLATTDMAAAATALLAMLALRQHLARPSAFGAAAVGAAFSVAVLTKFSALVFVPVLFGTVFLGHRLGGLRRPQRHTLGNSSATGLVQELGVAVAVGAFTLWLGYGFSIGRIGDLARHIGPWRVFPIPAERNLIERWLYSARIPAPELFHGLLTLAIHQKSGHAAYVLGTTSQFGFWYFYPVVLWFKTPLGFLCASIVAFGATIRDLVQRLYRGVALPEPTVTALEAMASAVGVLLVVASSNINIGLRHVLVVFPLLSVAVGGKVAAVYARSQMQHRAFLRLAIAALLLGQVWVAWGDRGRLLASFNIMAGDEPSQVALDSDMDWGQDLIRLRKSLNAKGASSVKLAYFGINDVCRFGLPQIEPLPASPTDGWIAISEFYTRGSTIALRHDPCDLEHWFGNWRGPQNPFAWLDAYQPVERLPSIRIYHIQDHGR